MEKRKDTRNKRKLLRKLGKGMVVFNQGNDTAVVSWKQRKAAQIAYQHHHGHSEKMTANRAAKRAGKADYTAPASRDMAKALSAEGYRRSVSTGNGRTKLKKVSQKWIRENMTQGQAGLVLKELRGDSGKKSWTLRTPARPVLGVNPAQSEQIMTGLARQALERIKAK